MTKTPKQMQLFNQWVCLKYLVCFFPLYYFIRDMAVILSCLFALGMPQPQAISAMFLEAHSSIPKSLSLSLKMSCTVTHLYILVRRYHGLNLALRVKLCLEVPKWFSRSSADSVTHGHSFMSCKYIHRSDFGAPKRTVQCFNYI